jgi:hypothetical protein
MLFHPGKVANPLFSAPTEAGDKPSSGKCGYAVWIGRFMSQWILGYLEPFVHLNFR